MIKDTVEKIKQLILGRRRDYQLVFNTSSAATQRVLKDLARFCRAHETTFHKDARTHALLEGRREVFIRIEQYLNLSTEEIYELHKVKSMTGES